MTDIILQTIALFLATLNVSASSMWYAKDRQKLEGLKELSKLSIDEELQVSQLRRSIRLAEFFIVVFIISVVGLFYL